MEDSTVVSSRGRENGWYVMKTSSELSFSKFSSRCGLKPARCFNYFSNELSDICIRL